MQPEQKICSPKFGLEDDQLGKSDNRTIPQRVSDEVDKVGVRLRRLIPPDPNIAARDEGDAQGYLASKEVISGMKKPFPAKPTPAKPALVKPVEPDADDEKPGKPDNMQKQIRPGIFGPIKKVGF